MKPSLSFFYILFIPFQPKSCPKSNLKLFEVTGNSLPETLRERQQIALLQGFDRNQTTFDRIYLQTIALQHPHP
jgi:hypothetical protein